jgi:uncharacterized protein
MFDPKPLIVYYAGMSIEQIKLKISPILHKYRVSYAGVFGSQARGEARPDSDVDILVRFEKTPSLVQFIRLENELKDTLKMNVDVVVQGSEKSFIKHAIEKDLAVVYGQG